MERKDEHRLCSFLMSTPHEAHAAEPTLIRFCFFSSDRRLLLAPNFVLKAESVLCCHWRLEQLAQNTLSTLNNVCHSHRHLIPTYIFFPSYETQRTVSRLQPKAVHVNMRHSERLLHLLCRATQHLLILHQLLFKKVC